jgi:hypothetical protein
MKHLVAMSRRAEIPVGASMEILPEPGPVLKVIQGVICCVWSRVLGVDVCATIEVLQQK